MGNMTFIDFLWLIHGLLCALYILFVGYYLWSRYVSRREIWEQIYDQNLDPHNNPVNEDDAARVVGMLLAGHAFAYGMAIEAVPVPLICLILAFGFCAKRLADVEPVLKQVEHAERLARRNKAKQPAEAGFESAPEDEAFFSYKEARGSAQGSHARSSAKDAPRGYDQRHPDDAALWAVVDDPAATENERHNAFSAILKREAKRKGKTGRELVRYSA